MKAIWALGASILVHAAAVNTVGAANAGSETHCAHGTPDKLVGTWEDSEQTVEKEYRLASTGKGLVVWLVLC